VLLLPWAFRLGLLFPSLVLFAAVTLYVERKERWLLAVLLAGACLVPPLAGAWSRSTTFAGTPAENVLQLERGGLEATHAAAQVQARLESGRATYPEVYALARLELRRGKLAPARAHAEKALALRSGDARAQTVLGNVAFAENRWPKRSPPTPGPARRIRRCPIRCGTSPGSTAGGEDPLRRRGGPELDRAQNARPPRSGSTSS
jgi:hypothetical protein